MKLSENAFVFQYFSGHLDFFGSAFSYIFLEDGQKQTGEVLLLLDRLDWTQQIRTVSGVVFDGFGLASRERRLVETERSKFFSLTWLPFHVINNIEE